MLATVFIVSGYWYVKAYAVCGNPFYPYFNRFFGLEPLLAASSHAVEEYGHKAGMGSGLLSLLALLLGAAIGSFRVRIREASKTTIAPSESTRGKYGAEVRVG